MRKGTFIAIIALTIAVIGAIVAFAAYFKHRRCALCDDFDEGMLDDDMSDLDYYATQVEEDDDDDYESAADVAADAEEETETEEKSERPSA